MKGKCLSEVLFHHEPLERFHVEGSLSGTLPEENHSTKNIFTHLVFLVMVVLNHLTTYRTPRTSQMIARTA